LLLEKLSKYCLLKFEAYKQSQVGATLHCCHTSDVCYCVDYNYRWELRSSGLLCCKQ